jgi:4-amino-4-deoxy-L-arabinose transferase-like glycosyltransferase
MRAMGSGEDVMAGRVGRTGPGHRFALALGAIVALGFIARVAYALTVGQHITFGLDTVWYELQASSITHGIWYDDPGALFSRGQRVPTANFPPIWPLTLALAIKIGLQTTTAYQVVGALIGSITVALTGFVGRRAVGPRVGLVAALLVAASPMLMAADGSIMSDSLYVTFVTAALLCSYRALARPSVARFALVGLFVGLAALTRSDGLFLVPILLVTLAWRVRATSIGRRLALGGSLLAVVVITQLPWVISSSEQLGGVTVLSTNGGKLLEGANCPATYGGPLIGAWSPHCQQDVGTPGKTELQWSNAARNAGLRFATAHLGRLPVVVAARDLRVWGLWSPVPQARLEAIESRNETWQLYGWGYDLLLLAAAVPGTVLLVRRRATIAPLVAVVIAVTVTAAVSYGNERFRLAAEPALAVAAAMSAVTLWQVAGRGRAGARPLGAAADDTDAWPAGTAAGPAADAGASVGNDEAQAGVDGIEVQQVGVALPPGTGGQVIGQLGHAGVDLGGVELGEG